MSDTEVYEASTIKRRRRSKREIERLKAALYAIVKQYHPMTVRQVFYQAVSRGLVDKTQNEYNNTVGRLLCQLRRDEELPFDWIGDETRWIRRPSIYDSIEDALEECSRLYRRNLWRNQGDFVQVWCEKDALAGVLYDVTAKWHAGLWVTRGYSSLSYLHTAADVIREQGKSAYLYYVGDHDPSGLDVERDIRQKLREFGAEFTFERVAVTEEQITNLGLLTRPTKPGDTRSRGFSGESVEVDAIEPPMLRDLVEACILRHIDQHALAVATVAERSEHVIMAQVMEFVRENEAI